MNVRQMEIVQDKDKLKVDLQQVLMKYKTIKKWAYILHDKDDTRPHYHIYVNFGGNVVSSKDVANWFQLGYTDKDGIEHSGEQFIEKVKGRSADMLMYLTHQNDSQQNKHQYSPDEVHANFDFKTEIQNAKILGDFNKYSYAQQLEYIKKLPISEQSSAYSKLTNLWKLHCQWLSLHNDRKIDVVFICGKGGTGKTYYAKKLLKSLNYDFCVSSSSNDPFQDYMGQKAIILDDFRDRSLNNFEDLLKLLDNNTASSVKSRFTNKVFNGEMIVITSSVPLCYWYKSGFGIRLEDFQQLYRRIGCYVVVTTEEITVYNEIDNNGKPCGLGRSFKNELAGIKKIEKQKTDFASMFEKICENVDLPDNAQLTYFKGLSTEVKK